MTHPANKLRTHNADARAVDLTMMTGGAERTRKGRRSPYAQKLEAKRMAAYLKEKLAQQDEQPAAVPGGEEE